MSTTHTDVEHMENHCVVSSFCGEPVKHVPKHTRNYGRPSASTGRFERKKKKGKGGAGGKRAEHECFCTPNHHLPFKCYTDFTLQVIFVEWTLTSDRQITPILLAHIRLIHARSHTRLVPTFPSQSQISPGKQDFLFWKWLFSQG